ncbi:MAG: electron transfer flavoprotein subunit beta/FixA family protein [Dehalococcoidia bacterium]
MHIVVAVKQVLDPEGVNSYALWGRLEVAPSGREFTVGDLVPHIINAYDEQAVEAALRLKDQLPDCRVTAVAVGSESTAEVLKRCVAMGVDDAVQVLDPESARADGFRTASLLAAVVGEMGDVEAVFCGRQGSDFDQGTVPAVLAERIGAGYVTLAADIASADGGLRIRRATAAGEEVVEVRHPAVVTVSNELGTPRYPTSRGMLQARRNRPAVREARDLVGEGDASAGVEIVELFVPDVQGHCEVIEGDSPAAKAMALMERLRETGALDA